MSSTPTCVCCEKKSMVNGTLSAKTRFYCYDCSQMAFPLHAERTRVLFMRSERGWETFSIANNRTLFCSTPGCSSQVSRYGDRCIQCNFTK